MPKVMVSLFSASNFAGLSPWDVLVRVISGLLCLVMLSFAGSTSAAALGEVTLQLKWQHQAQFAGYYVALEKGFFEEEGLSVRLRPRDFSRSPLRQVLAGEAEYGVGDAAILPHVGREDGLHIVAPIFQHSPNVLVTRAGAGIRSPADLVGKRVAFYEFDSDGFPVLSMLAEYGVLDDGLVRMPYGHDLDALIRGEVDAAPAYGSNELVQAARAGFETHALRPASFGVDLYGDMLFTTMREQRANPKRVAAMRRAVLKGWDYALTHPEEIARLIHEKYRPDRDVASLLAEVEALRPYVDRERIPLGTLDRGRIEYMNRLFARHGLAAPGQAFSEQVDRASGGRLELTAEERRFLEEHPVIRVAIDNYWEPIEFVDEQGNYAGMAADYMALLSEKLGVTFVVSKGVSWSDASDMLRRRELDMFSCAARTPERERYAMFTAPYIRSPMVVVTRDDQPFIPDLDELAGLRVGTPDGYASEEYMALHHPSVPLVTVESVREGLRAVAAGELDAFIDNLAVVSHHIEREGLGSLKISGQTQLSFDLAMGVRSDWPMLRNILQKALDSISDEQRTEIFNRWVRINYERQIDYQALLPWVFGGLVMFLLTLAYSLRLRGLNRQVGTINRELVAQRQALHEKNEQLRRLSHTDQLTGLFNRRSLDQALAREVADAGRKEGAFSIVLFDLDEFKQVNDLYGHQAGDEVLVECGRRVSGLLGPGQVLGRWGGEEFMVLCPGMDSAVAFDWAERLRWLIAAEAFPGQIAQTVSVGVAGYAAGLSVDDLIRRADAALYQAKEQGRNRVVSAD
ncbi:MAG: transporter substrate-binding domain-containing diguanylate cyclase [Halothiobacillaceae bacterium]